MIVLTVLGGEPTTAREYFEVLQNDRLTGILRMDFPSLINVMLFTVTGYALLLALRETNRVLAGFSTGLIFAAVAVSFATHPGFSIIHLSDKYAAARDAAERTQFLTAGEVVINTGWWESTGGIMAGIFLQGGMVLLSIIMLQNRRFMKATAITGILSNGLDWLHVLVGIFLPGVGTVILAGGGVFYLAWFPLLGWDLIGLGRKQEENSGKLTGNSTRSAV
jgi:hypothetical protein